MFKYLFLVFWSYFFFLNLSSTSLAQDDNSIAYYQKKFPTSAGVIIDRAQTVTISVNKKSGELDIYETDYEEILYINKSAKYYAAQSITTSDFFEDIIDINAIIITPKGKKIKVKKDAFQKVDAARASWVFHDENREINFDLGPVEIGTTSIISYTKKVKIPQFFDVFHFISNLPTNTSSIEISYPENMDLTFYERSFEKFNITKQESLEKKGIKKITWQLTDAPAYRRESGAVNTHYSVPHIVGQIKSYTHNSEDKTVIADIKGLHQYFQEFLLAKGDESNRGELNAEVRKATSHKKTQKEKMDTIFNWVQANIKYIAFEDGINGYVPRSCSQVIGNRYGDCKDMGNLLVEMLTFAGVENAYIAWVGTRDIPYLMGEIPMPFSCNHVICVVEKPGGGYYYLDATNSEGSYNFPTSGIQGKDLLIHKGENKYELHTVQPMDADRNYFKSFISYSFIPGDSIRGSGKDRFGGYERESRAYKIDNSDEKDKLDYIKNVSLNGENKYTLHSYSLENVKDKETELIINYDFSVDGILIPYNEGYVLNPSLFKPAVRRYNNKDQTQPRKKDHHRTIEYIFKFTVPQGYKITTVPDNVSFKHDLFDYQGTFNLENAVLTVSHKYQYNLLQIPPSLFDQWNAFSKAIQEGTRQNVILQKII